MPVATVASLLGALRTHRLLEPQQLEQAARWAAKVPDPRALGKELIQRGFLTPYQINQVMQGKAAELLMGSYVLLERLGEGGMGQVFKARHVSMGRVVALKVLHKELLAKEEAVKRFHREIRLVATLHHPNIVLAFDADKVNDVHFLAMEYVEGIDLGRLVKKQGRLPVRDACDYIRQAALGLQHAFEKGLVHRDIKPSNLLRADQGGVVKLLDLGLARLQEADDDSSSSVVSGVASPSQQSFLTQTGKVMGTPDFIAPEQARDSHTVDIRADLYSLGCTFYFLLAGKVPFNGRTALEKIVQHQSEEAPLLEKLRPEVPTSVAGLIRQLMAKRPEQRLQTPGILAAALGSPSGAGALSGPVSGVRLAPRNSGPVPIPAAIPVALPTAVAVAPARRRRFFTRARVGVLLLLLVIVLAGLGVLPLLRRATDPPLPDVDLLYLADVPEKEVVVGRGYLGKNGDLGYDNRRVTVNGIAAPHGLSMFPADGGTAQATYHLDRRFHYFTATVAVNDRGPGDFGFNVGSPLLFRVVGDNKELWRSRTLRQFGDSDTCTNLAIRGVDKLQLVVECVPRQTQRCYAVWVNPQVRRETAAKTP